MKAVSTTFIIAVDISDRDIPCICFGHPVSGTNAISIDKWLMGKRALKFYKKYLKETKK